MEVEYRLKRSTRQLFRTGLDCDPLVTERLFKHACIACVEGATLPGLQKGIPFASRDDVDQGNHHWEKCD